MTPPPQLIVGIPTRDRPVSLRACIESLARLGERYGRHIPLLVVDDARGAENRQITHQLVEALAPRFPGTITCIDRPSRERLARQLAYDAGIDPELVRFALLGDDRLGPSYGAARNTLLLATAGNLLLMVDDDTRFEAYAMVDILDTTPVWHPGDPEQFYVYAEERQVRDAVRQMDVDLLAEHEAVLGCPAATLLEEYPDDRTVIFSSMGTWGDSGMSGHAFRMMAEGPALDRLLVSREAFEEGMTSRWLVKSTRQREVVPARPEQALHLALDNRVLMPPFVPVLRNEEGVFSALVDAGVAGATMVLHPWLVSHLPEPPRPPLPLQTALTPPRMRTNDVLALACNKLVRVYFDMDGLLDDTGRALAVMAGRDEVSFVEWIDRICDSMRRTGRAMLQEQIRQHSERPIWWHEASQKYATELGETRSTLADELSDLSHLGPGAVAAFQELAGRWGRLLEAWPAIYDAARRTAATWR